MYYTYTVKIKIPDGSGGTRDAESTRGFNMSSILDFGLLLSGDITELMVRLNAKESKMVPKMVKEGNKEVLKNVKEEVHVTHLINTEADILKFQDAIKVFS